MTSDSRPTHRRHGACECAHPVSIFLRSNHNQRLTFHLTSTNTLLFAAPVCLVHFYHPGEAIPPRSHHGTPQFMQPSPRRVVSAQPQNTLEADSAGTVLLAGDCPHRPKPNGQRFAVSWKIVPAVTEL